VTIPRWISQRPTSRAFVAIGVIVLAVLGVVYGEQQRWPWLSKPMAQGMTKLLHREVSFDAAHGEPGRAQFQFLGSFQMWAPDLSVASPGWSNKPFLVRAKGSWLRMRYADIWRAWRGGGLQIEGLQADELDAHLERLADGRSSWLFNQAPDVTLPDDQTERPWLKGLAVQYLALGRGRIAYDDAPLQLSSLSEVKIGISGPRTREESTQPLTKGLSVITIGRLKGATLTLNATSPDLMPWLFGGARAAWPLRADLRVGSTRVRFQGTVDGFSQQSDVIGNLVTSGDSLATMAGLLGLTLPTTGPVDVRAVVHHRGLVTDIVVQSLRVGSSRLHGAFQLDRSGKLPMLAGRLQGQRLALVDLGPAIGVQPVSGASAAARTRVLPDRPFNLPALANMDANVLMDIDVLDLNTEFVKPLAPLQGHLTLRNAILRIDKISTRTARGSLKGWVELDGRQTTVAKWKTDLSLADVQLQEWVPALAPIGRAPFLSGRLDGRVQLTGVGRSTAAILADLDGNIQARLRQAQLSHLGIELAGIDVAQALGVYIKGDDALPLQCARADILAKRGVLVPKVMVVDTTDSTVGVRGSVSLVDETLKLDVAVAPKDVSLLALRMPLKVRGTLANPVVSLDPKPLGVKAAVALGLGLAVGPAAVLIALVDGGDRETAQALDKACAQDRLSLIP
jgi:uncharacterized protein involved in outer membrane biogenesis